MDTHDYEMFFTEKERREATAAYYRDQPARRTAELAARRADEEFDRRLKRLFRVMFVAGSLYLVSVAPWLLLVVVPASLGGWWCCAVLKARAQ